MEEPTLWNKYFKAVATSIHSDGNNGFQGYPQTATKCLEIHRDHLTKAFIKSIRDGKFKDLENESDDIIKLYINELMETILL